ncbi:MAG: hypothetical protein JWP03_1603 [Phycisphaerales bacterium]|jgi:hypothetical protein|nr:hypothetical protein [Phycisphaerales bacterium]
MDHGSLGAVTGTPNLNALLFFRAGACRPGRAAGPKRSFAPTGPARPGSEVASSDGEFRVPAIAMS